MHQNWIVVGALWGFLGVALGAFGAHGLERMTDVPEALAWWETAALYHLLHAPVLVLLGLLQRSKPGGGDKVGWCLILGSLVFSGTLYAMALGAPRVLGAVTPLGGLLLLAGWLGLAWYGR